MAGAGGGKSLEETPTWAVALVCFVFVAMSIFIEQIIHFIGKWLKKNNKSALYEALEKIKSELMLLGFISLLLTVGKGTVSEICIPKALGNSCLPCDRKLEEAAAKKNDGGNDHKSRRLLSFLDSSRSHRRSLAAAVSIDKCAAKGKVQLISEDGMHQLHIFIFVLAIFHVTCCILTLALGRAKMYRWKAWELETKTLEYQCAQEPERFRFARDTTFGRRHLNFWTRSPVLIWTACFFRQFVRSVPKTDYLTLRHGFIIAHLAPHSQTNFDFQKYINRSLEEDFKVVVGISPPIWFLAVLFLLFNTNSWRSYFWLPFIPLIIVLVVGTKLQVIITKMGISIQERGEVVQGIPVVQPTNDLFWFNRPSLLLYLIHFVFFQNAFQLAFFAWALFEYGPHSCFHEKIEDVIIKISMGVIVQIICSYVTLPQYALVTQMGSTMKPTIFDDRVAKALHNWQQGAKRNLKKNRCSGSVMPSPSKPGTPVHYHETEVEGVQSSPKLTNFSNAHLQDNGGGCASFPVNLDDKDPEAPREPVEAQEARTSAAGSLQHQIDIYSKELSFNPSS